MKHFSHQSVKKIRKITFSLRCLHIISFVQTTVQIPMILSLQSDITKQQILTFKQLETKNAWLLAWKNNSIIIIIISTNHSSAIV